MGKQRKFPQMRIILTQLESRTDQTVATGTIDEVSRAESALAGLDGDSIRVKSDIGDLGASRDPATAFGRMIKQQLVEHRTFDLIGGRVFAAKDVAEQKAIAPSAAGRNNFAAIFHDDIGLIEFLFDPHAFKGAEAAWQKGFADFETRRCFLFENRNIPSLLRQQSSRGAPGRSAAHNNDVEELSHEEAQQSLPVNHVPGRCQQES